MLTNADVALANEDAGMMAGGINPDLNLVEIIELKNHPWFIAVQYHPEYKSTVENPHPLFVGFVAAAKEYNEQKANSKNTVLQGETL